ncbi:hypothetical protein KJ762_08200 [bacterium]|nr:hypothetical protein [bacterium]MBU1063464.1 hypothetical protein [bacterium]MBU1634474.1 hypothetical protein [bacterium]MBU1874648.1 hypothetical protein [bacterium]
MSLPNSPYPEENSIASELNEFRFGIPEFHFTLSGFCIAGTGAPVLKDSFIPMNRNSE